MNRHLARDMPCGRRIVRQILDRGDAAVESGRIGAAAQRHVARLMTIVVIGKAVVLAVAAERPAGQDLRHRDDVVLRVAAVHAERVELHQFAAEIFVESLAGKFSGARMRADRLRIVEIQKHRGMARGGQHHVLELSGDVRADRLTLERADESDGARILRRNHEVIAPEPHEPFGERPVGREAERVARGELVEEFLRLDLEEHLDRIGAGPVALLHRPVALVLEHFHDQIAAVLEAAAVQRHRLIGGRIDLGQQPRLGISAGAVDFSGPRAETEPVRGYGTFQRHVGYLIRGACRFTLTIINGG